MKIIITEDDHQKLDEIVEFTKSLGVSENSIVTASNMAEFSAKFDDSISICIIDLRIPAYDGAAPDTNGIGILQAVEKVGAGRVKLLAISSYPDEFEALRGKFESRGCMLVSFLQKDIWQSALRLMIVQSQGSELMDFLIFCALREERAPYTAMPALRGKAVFTENLTRFDISISGRKGSVIELPRIGLVDAAATASICLERFKPKIVAMSGICAGFAGRANMGQLLISELAYEYQSGKWTDDGFSQEPYQVPSAEDARSVVRELIEDSGILARLEEGWQSTRPSGMTPPKLVTFTSGSAVIAKEELMDQVSSYHKRVIGLDMEVYAVHRACHLARSNPDVICAKTVVDLGNGQKDDKLHAYGSSISARFVVEALTTYFSRGI
jgi:adenosylhomocysteine nucleosidase